MNKPTRLVIGLAALLLAYGPSIGSCSEVLLPAATEEHQAVSARTLWSVNIARPGDSPVLALILDIQNGHHINADADQIKPVANFVPVPTRVRVVNATKGIVTETARYPAAHPVQLDFAEQPLMVFDGRVTIYLPVRIGSDISPGAATIGLEIAYQACGENFCLLPETISLDTGLEIAAGGTPVQTLHPDIFADYYTAVGPDGADRVHFDAFGWTFAVDTSAPFGLILLLTVAATGGLLLNVTPCVLPMIPIKIISLSRASDDRTKSFGLGLSMFAGVMAFWLVLGGLIGLVSEVSATNQLFHYPLLTILIGVIIAGMGIAMFRSFSIRLPNFIYRLNPDQTSVTGSFGVGILTAVLSTPCTAPFMGAAAAWAATQQPSTTFVTFAAIGTGMGMPYLVLSAFPSLVGRMPRSGPASELIKQTMGIFILAAAAYFIGVGITAMLASPSDLPHRFYWWPVMILCALAGLRLFFGVLRIAAGKRFRFVCALAGLMIAVLAITGGVKLTDTGPVDWIPYTPERLEEARSAKRVVVMAFTAEWCLNCKALEQNVFKNPRIIDLLGREDITAIKVDITGNNPAGKAKLREIGHLTIPLLLIYSPNGCRILKSDFYTVDQVAAAVREALENEKNC